MEGPSAGSSPAVALNLPAALSRLGGDQALLRDLAVFYLEDVPPLCQQLSEALDNGDAESAVRCAHTIKALSSNFDAYAATDAAQRIERATRMGDLVLAREALPELRSAVEAVVGGLQTEIV